MSRLRSLLACLLLACLLAGCGGQQPAGGQAAQPNRTDSVVIAMDVNSEPAAGFDPAYGWE